MSVFRSVTDASSSGSTSDLGYSSNLTNLEDEKGRESEQDAASSSLQDGSIAHDELFNAEELLVSRSGFLDIKDIFDKDVKMQSVMTSALLEFYCLTRAADILNSRRDPQHRQFTRDSPEVQYLGRTMYAYKSQFLSSNGFLASGLEREDLRNTRQSCLDNLDLLGVGSLNGLNLDHAHGQQSPSLPRIANNGRQLLATGKHAGPCCMRRRIFDENAEPFREFENSPYQMLSTFPSYPTGYSLDIPRPIQPVNSNSRYVVEFREIKFLGRGSFGDVHHGRNYIDGQDYAVKRIPLSHRRLEQLKFAGHNQLENIMREIRTLARLENVNIVRYYGAWLEQADIPRHDIAHDQSTNSQSIRLVSLTGEEDDQTQSFRVVFEDSVGEANSSSVSHDQGLTEFSGTPQYPGSCQSSRRGFQDGDEEDVNSTNSASHSQPSTINVTDDDIFTDGLSENRENKSRLQVQRQRQHHGLHAPAIILHIQMSLHPFSLSSYLTAHQRVNNETPSCRHCFHLIPSLRIMLDIIHGVEYLHSRKIVHRDLKPANIFLSPPDEADDESRACPTCKTEHGVDSAFYHPRIGDFGLVADISHIRDDMAYNQTAFDRNRKMHTIVGTEFYRPCNGDARVPSEPFYSIDEKLDVYALGVIFFELLYRLDTKMERQLILAQLTRNSDHRQSCLPEDFARKVDMGQMLLDGRTSVAESLTACIKGMLSMDPRERWSCQAVKIFLKEILRAVMT